MMAMGHAYSLQQIGDPCSPVIPTFSGRELVCPDVRCGAPLTTSIVTVHKIKTGYTLLETTCKLCMTQMIPITTLAAEVGLEGYEWLLSVGLYHGVEMSTKFMNKLNHMRMQSNA